MSRRLLALLIVGSLAVVAVAIIAFRIRQPTHAPLDALQQLVNAARARDRAAIERYLDVGRTAESVVNEAVATARAMGEDTDSAMTPLLVSAMQQAIWSALIDSLATLEARYQGLAGVEQRGDVARVGVRIRSEDGDSTFVAHLRMERTVGQWRVVGIEDLGPYMRTSLARRRERADEAQRRSTLRNRR